MWGRLTPDESPDKKARLFKINWKKMNPDRLKKYCSFDVKELSDAEQVVERLVTNVITNEVKMIPI